MEGHVKLTYYCHSSIIIAKVIRILSDYKVINNSVRKIISPHYPNSVKPSFFPRWCILSLEIDWNSYLAVLKKQKLKAIRQQSKKKLIQRNGKIKSFRIKK